MQTEAQPRVPATMTGEADGVRRGWRIRGPSVRASTAEVGGAVRVCALAAVRISRPDQVLLILAVLSCGAVAGAELTTGGGHAETTEMTAIGAVVTLVAVSVHAANEFADVETDARTVRTRFSGGSGALKTYGLGASFALRLAVAAGLMAVVGAVAGVAVGLWSVTVTVLLLGGLVGGWQYSVPPLALSRHGGGEVANALLGGLLLPVTGAAVVGAAVTTAAVQFVPFALLGFVNLLETQWADRMADRAVGKRTLASRLSPRALRVGGAVAVIAAYGLSVLVQPAAVAAAGLFAAPLSVLGVWRLGRGAPGPSVAAMVVFLLAQGAAWATL